MSAPDELPRRTTDIALAVDWLGAAWRVGLSLDAAEYVRALTIDSDDETIDIDAAALGMLRGAFEVMSSRLPLASAALEEAARSVADTPLGAALAEAARVQREEGPRFAWLCARLDEMAAKARAAAGEDAPA